MRENAGTGAADIGAVRKLFTNTQPPCHQAHIHNITQCVSYKIEAGFRSLARVMPCRRLRLRAFRHLPKRRFGVSATLPMRLFRPISAALMAFVFVFSTNRCAIAAAFPIQVEECCPGENPSGDSEAGLTCSGNDCLQCATLDSGVHPASLVPLTATAPVWTEAHEFAERMRRLAIAVVQEVSAAPPDRATYPPPPWCVVMMKALPVRGPSLVA